MTPSWFAVARRVFVRWFTQLMEAKAAARPLWLEAPPPKLVCCYCAPPHVLRDGPEPASHGACQRGVARFEAGGRA